MGVSKQGTSATCEAPFGHEPWAISARRASGALDRLIDLTFFFGRFFLSGLLGLIRPQIIECFCQSAIFSLHQRDLLAIVLPFGAWAVKPSPSLRLSENLDLPPALFLRLDQLLPQGLMAMIPLHSRPPTCPASRCQTVQLFADSAPLLKCGNKTARDQKILPLAVGVHIFVKQLSQRVRLV